MRKCWDLDNIPTFTSNKQIFSFHLFWKFQYFPINFYKQKSGLNDYKQEIYGRFMFDVKNSLSEKLKMFEI